MTNAIDASIDMAMIACLQKGTIWIGEGNGIYTATLMHYDEVLYRVSSDKGVRYVLLMLIAQIIPSPSLSAQAEDEYIYPVSIRTMTPLDRLLARSYTVIGLEKGEVAIDRYCTCMPSSTSIPACHYTRGSGRTWLLAVQDLLQNTHL